MKLTTKQKIKMKKSETFQTSELGTSYYLPKFRVVDGKGIQEVIDLEPENDGLVHSMDERPDAYQKITFVRGDKTDNGTVIPRVDGILHEQLLGVMIEDLTYKISLVSSDESKEALKHLKLALFWLEERQREREKRNVAGTYQK
jgi:hypothetical protein